MYNSCKKCTESTCVRFITPLIACILGIGFSFMTLMNFIDQREFDGYFIFDLIILVICLFGIFSLVYNRYKYINKKALQLDFDSLQVNIKEGALINTHRHVRQNSSLFTTQTVKLEDHNKEQESTFAAEEEDQFYNNKKGQKVEMFTIEQDHDQEQEHLMNPQPSSDIQALKKKNRRSTFLDKVQINYTLNEAESVEDFNQDEKDDIEEEEEEQKQQPPLPPMKVIVHLPPPISPSN